MEWERASPMSDIFLSTMKHPNIPQVTPTINDVIRALRAHSDVKLVINASKIEDYTTKLQFKTDLLK